jgi:hypothetical protein
VEINSTWEIIRENIKISVWEIIRENIKISVKDSLGYFELKKHKPWFNEGCSKLVDQRKQGGYRIQVK